MSDSCTCRECENKQLWHCTISLRHHNLLVVILSLLHSYMSCRRSCYIFYYLVSNLLAHYLAKLERSTVQLYSKVIPLKSVKNRLFTANIYDGCHILNQINLLNLACSKYPPSARMRALSHAHCTPLVSGCIDGIVQCGAKCFTGAVTKYRADVKIKWCQRHSESRKSCTGQVLPSANYRPTRLVVDAALRRIGKSRHGGIFLVVAKAEKNFSFFLFPKFGCTLPPCSG